MTCISISRTATGGLDSTKAGSTLGIDLGQHVVIVGGTGTGKTALANALAGLEGTSQWNCQIDDPANPELTGHDRSRWLGLVPSDPALAFSHLAQTVRREMELSSELLGEPADDELVKRWLERLRLTHLANRDPLTLSGGERARAAIAIVLAKGPSIFVVDDIQRELDADAERLCIEVLQEERETRGMVVIELASVAPRSDLRPGAEWAVIGSDRVHAGSLATIWRQVSAEDRTLLPTPARTALELEDRSLAEFDLPPESARNVARQLNTEPSVLATALSEGSPSTQIGAPGVDVRDLVFSYPTGDFSLGPLGFQAPAGTATALVGPNGAGKTTLLRCLGNLNRGWQGTITATGGSLGSATALHEWARLVTYCFQNPDDQLYLPTVRRELEESAKRLGRADDRFDDRLNEVAHAFGLMEVLDTSPFDLPRPLRRLVTLASGFIANPPVLLLDEPTVALDASQVLRFTAVLERFVENGGMAIFISHDYDFVAEVADSVVFMDSGQITRSIHRGETPAGKWLGDTSPFTTEVLQELGIEGPPLVRMEELMDALTTARKEN